jgi:hypothetical protein
LNQVPSSLRLLTNAPFLDANIFSMTAVSVLDIQWRLAGAMMSFWIVLTIACLLPIVKSAWSLPKSCPTWVQNKKSTFGFLVQ